jgi:rsbT antagonist protein RsbS
MDDGKIPIIKLYGNLVVPIQVALSDRLVARLKDDVSNEIEARAPWGLVIDVSGVDIMDSYITRTIRDIALIARLMGVRTVLSGMAPMIAMTLVEMGMELAGVATELNLELALERLRRERTEAGPTASVRLAEQLGASAEGDTGHGGPRK